MTVANVRMMSNALGKQVTYNVLLPEQGEGPFPVLMQLHGLSDDCNAWIERSNLARYAARYPMIIVLPDGGTSAYLNWKPAGRLNRQYYEDLLMEDIPQHVRWQFNVRSGPWAIGGLSMGGFGAMRLGLKYPDRFASIYAHSSAFMIPDELEPEMAAAETLIVDRADADVYRHAEALTARAERPVISFDCGTEDELLEQNRRFHAYLQEKNIAHFYAEYPGAHTWEYWDEHVQAALAQHARVFGVEPIERT